MENELIKGIRFATESLFPIMSIISLVFAFILHKLFAQINDVSIEIWIRGCFCFAFGIFFVALRNIAPLYLGYIIGNFLIAYSHYLCLKSCEFFFNREHDRKKIPEVICLIYGLGFALLKYINLESYMAIYVGIFTMLLHGWLFSKLMQLKKLTGNYIQGLIAFCYLFSSIIWAFRIYIADLYNFGESVSPGFINWFTLLVLTLIIMVKNSFFIAMLQEWTNQNLYGAKDIIRQRDDLIDSLNDEKYKYEMASGAKSQFLANVSHELRTPLHGLIGMLSIVIKSDIAIETHKSIDKAIYSAKALLTILNDILDFAKIESGIMTIDNSHFLPQQLFDDVKDLFDIAAKDKGIELIFEIDPKLPKFLIGDFYKIRQVIFNLVGNSIKFTNSGTVKVKACVYHQDNHWVGITIFVIDSGIGISAEKIDDVLLPFNQVDNANTRSYQGVGLGLPISQKILSNLGSNLEIQSEHNSGTKVWFRLCLKTDSAHSTSNSPKKNEVKSAIGAFNGSRAIIAEDNPINTEVLRNYLNYLHIDALYVTNGKKCLEQMENNHFDFVLMDIQMPELDGLETTKIIRSNPKYEGIPIIGLSASSAQSDYAIALQSGMNDFLVKPFDLDTFSRVLEKHLNYKSKNP